MRWELTSGENPAYPQRHENCYLFAGTKGSLAVPKMEWWHYGDQVGWHDPLICERLAVEQVDPLARQIRHFCRVIRGEEQPLITAADAARTLAVTLSVNEASRTGRPVQF